MTNGLEHRKSDQPQISGSIPALVTPMTSGGFLDIMTLRALVDWHISEGSNALVVMGSTGECATLDFWEHCEVIGEVVAHSAGRVPVIAGTGANSTSEALELTEHAKRVGADAALLVAPYYNRPSQEGILQHYRKIAETVDIPLILYNIPSRTGVHLEEHTVLRLAEVPGIVGLKDATGDIARGTRLIHSVPDSFSVFSGDDETAAALIMLGAKGNISVTANVVPRLMRQLCDSARSGDVAAVRTLSGRLYQLNQALLAESNPIPVKWALSKMGRIFNVLRLPLTPLNALHEAGIVEALIRAEVDTF